MDLPELYHHLFGLSDQSLIQRLTEWGELRNVKKGHLLYREGETPTKRTCLVQGLLRGYFLDAGVELDIRTENVSVFTDEKWLSFILSQIIQNALKYFDKPKKVLSIYSEENNTSVSLVIRDNGCGISASDLPRIFEKGFTGSDRTKNASTGMGLYLAQRIFRLHGMELKVENTADGVQVSVIW